jgi:ERCC4-type nuclease
MKSEVTVLVDSREQRPLLFPDTLALWSVGGAGRPPKAKVLTVHKETVKLDAGDIAIREGFDTSGYALAGWETLAGVERKVGIVPEIAKNVLDPKDRPRFLRAFHRLADQYEHPYLFIEQWPEPWWMNSSENIEVTQAMDSILSLAAKYHVGLLWGGRPLKSVISRRRAGELILRVLLAHVTELAP